MLIEDNTLILNRSEVELLRQGAVFSEAEEDDGCVICPWCLADAYTTQYLNNHWVELSVEEAAKLLVHLPHCDRQAYVDLIERLIKGK